MVNIFKHFYYGILIGVSVITPGLSGGTTALILGVYKDIMENASLLNKKPIKSICYLLPFLTGAVLGLLICLKPIKYIIENYELLLNYFVLGIILGSTPVFLPKSKKFQLKNILLILVGAVPVVAQLYFNSSINYSNILYDAFVAFLSAVALILPGISLTNILICFGKYELVINSLTSCCYKEIVMFLILLVIETVACVKIINYFYKKKTESINIMLLGMVLASAISLVKIIPCGIEIIYCGLLLICGFCVSFIFSRLKV